MQVKQTEMIGINQLRGNDFEHEDTKTQSFLYEHRDTVFLLTKTLKAFFSVSFLFFNARHRK